MADDCGRAHYLPVRSAFPPWAPSLTSTSALGMGVGSESSGAATYLGATRKGHFMPHQ
eukprot:CAMPEP_0167801774 /NCGR_PEP_ID=MMETSP0111_2-20121227/18673_1 /TAXON_ID=91324 /ORGANISM="Lotharella globosa, Strain CCCM811" /LENGTH=57 /DNA_ID=CAMNT_0007697581 /DNA_START=280 /DNA_END=450 /DNA_ORIENTATION=+